MVTALFLARIAFTEIIKKKKTCIDIYSYEF